MSAKTMEQVITSFIERRVPYNGPVESEVWNDSIEELVHDIVLFQTLWNTLLYPLLGSMPSGPVEITAADRIADISPIDNGLDGSQLYMDMTSTATDELYYSSILERPYTIKESFEVFQDDVDDAIQEAKEAALLAGITEDAKQKIGARIFYTGRTSSPDSLDGLLERLDLLVDQLVADIFNEGFDEDAPPDYSSYPLSGGLQSRDNTIMEYIDSLLYMHDISLGQQHLTIHHVFVDPALEGQPGVPQVWTDMVKMSGLVSDLYADGSWPGVPQHLEDELNQIKTAIRRLAGWAGTPAEYTAGDHVFGLGVDSWTDLPYDAKASPDRRSLKGHMNLVGGGTVDDENPHGLEITDIDNLTDLITLGILDIDADYVGFDPTAGSYLQSGDFGGAANEHVQKAIELLEDAIEANDVLIAANAAAIAVNAADIATNAADIATNLASIGLLQTYQSNHQAQTLGLGDPAGALEQHGTTDIFLRSAWVAASSGNLVDYTGGPSNVEDAFDTIDAALVGVEARVAALDDVTTGLVTIHLDSDNIPDDAVPGKHDGEQIGFTSNTTEPLEYPTGHPDAGDSIVDVENAVNEFHQLWIDDRREQDAKINASIQEAGHYGNSNIPTLFTHHLEIYVDPVGGSDDPPPNIPFGLGTSGFPYATINRALADVGKMVIPKVSIYLADGDYDETVYLDYNALDLGELEIVGNATNPENVKINGGSVVSKKVYFFGAGPYNMTSGGTYSPTVAKTKTTFYVQIENLGVVTEIQDDVPESAGGGGGSLAMTLTNVPDDDQDVTFTDDVVFATEITFVDGSTELTGAGEYSIDYPNARVYTYDTTDATDAGYVTYFRVDSVDTFTWWKDNEATPTAGPQFDIDIVEDVPHALDQGVTVTFSADANHAEGDLYYFTAYPGGNVSMVCNGAKGIRVEDLTVDGGMTIRGHSRMECSNIIVRNSLDHAILVREGSHLRLDGYFLHSCPGDGLHVSYNSHVIAADFDPTLDPAPGPPVSGYGGHALWHSGIETCVLEPVGATPGNVTPGLQQDNPTLGIVTNSCPTTTTSSSTTTTSSSSTSTSSTYTTSSSTSSTSSSAPTLPFMLLVGDGAGAGPPPPVSAAPWTPGPVPGPPLFGNIDENVFGPPAPYPPGAPQDVDEVANSPIPGPGPTGGPAAEQFVLGAVSLAGTYSAAILHVRMVSFDVGLSDALGFIMYDNTGAVLVPPSPPVMSNTVPGLYENIVSIPLPFGGPTLDTLISGGTLEIVYFPGVDAGINISDVRVDLI